VSRRVALVTGGRRGIGLGVAAALAREGLDVAICGVHEAAAAREPLDVLKAAGAAAVYVQADVSRAEDRARLLAAVHERFGALHVLVNNAGVAPEERADLLDMAPESFERVMRINLEGPFFLTQAASRWMIEQRTADPAWRGCIVNVSSISATAASVNRGEYCISKAGVAMATRLWAARLAGEGIPVYEVRPGIIRTDMTAGVTEKYDRLIAGGLLPQARWGEPEDVGRALQRAARKTADDERGGPAVGRLAGDADFHAVVRAPHGIGAHPGGAEHGHVGRHVQVPIVVGELRKARRGAASRPGARRSGRDTTGPDGSCPRACCRSRTSGGSAPPAARRVPRRESARAAGGHC